MWGSVSLSVHPVETARGFACVLWAQGKLRQGSPKEDLDAGHVQCALVPAPEVKCQTARVLSSTRSGR